MRHYVAEPSGAVLCVETGLREWFDSYEEAIRVAELRGLIAREAAAPSTRTGAAYEE